MTPKLIPTPYNVCGVPFTMENTCGCKIGGFITLRHNIMADEKGDICGKYLTFQVIYDEPRIHTGRPLKGKGS